MGWVDTWVGLGWVGLRWVSQLMVGLGWVTKNGPMDNFDRQPERILPRHAIHPRY